MGQPIPIELYASIMNGEILSKNFILRERSSRDSKILEFTPESDSYHAQFNGVRDPLPTLNAIVEWIWLDRPKRDWWCPVLIAVALYTRRSTRRYGSPPQVPAWNFESCHPRRANALELGRRSPSRTLASDPRGQLEGSIAASRFLDGGGSSANRLDFNVIAATVLFALEAKIAKRCVYLVLIYRHKMMKVNLLFVYHLWSHITRHIPENYWFQLYVSIAQNYIRNWYWRNKNSK